MARTQKLPKRLQPMLATLIEKPFDDPRWVFETKWDGFRMVADISKKKVALYSRNGEVVSEKYAPIARELKKIAHSAVVDGELVALDSRGISRFQLLQNALRTKVRLRYYVFDIMFLDGKDLRALPLIERKARLKKILPGGRYVTFSTHREENGRVFFAQAKKIGLEGIMAKRAASPYSSGKRTREWLKIKTGARQEVVIVGYTKPRGSREYFGALVIGVYEKGKLQYAGRVGTGFDRIALKDLYTKLRPLRAKKKPFNVKVRDEAATTWVKPQLVGEIQFTEWTAKGEMRHPAFIGLRTDKRAREVVREHSL